MIEDGSHSQFRLPASHIRTSDRWPRGYKLNGTLRLQLAPGETRFKPAGDIGPDEPGGNGSYPTCG